jgi:two-component system phosphate regulon sensor histidine kinase PhoR
VLFANDRAHDLLELTPGGVAGRKFWEVVRHPALLEAIREAPSGDLARGREVAWTGATARSLAVRAVRVPGPPPAGTVLVLHDTTELRRLERVRQEFVANVSHELKTPLTVVKAAAETLLDGAADDPEARRLFLGQIGEQADRLTALVHDLLSLARIEGGTETLDLRSVSLEPVVAECLARHAARAEAKRQTLEAAPPSGTAVTAWGDEEAIEQILDNLVDNAVKYTPSGGRIRVRWRAEGNNAVLEVEDTGIGIPEHHLSRVFERFYRVDRARSREMGGTGLGLSIVKHLAQAMGGSVTATSRLGRGSTFVVQLPTTPPR